VVKLYSTVATVFSVLLSWSVLSGFSLTNTSVPLDILFTAKIVNWINVTNWQTHNQIHSISVFILIHTYVRALVDTSIVLQQRISCIVHHPSCYIMYLLKFHCVFLDNEFIAVTGLMIKIMFIYLVVF